MAFGSAYFGVSPALSSVQTRPEPEAVRLEAATTFFLEPEVISTWAGVEPAAGISLETVPTLAPALSLTAAPTLMLVVADALVSAAEPVAAVEPASGVSGMVVEAGGVAAGAGVVDGLAAGAGVLVAGGVAAVDGVAVVACAAAKAGAPIRRLEAVAASQNLGVIHLSHGIASAPSLGPQHLRAPRGSKKSERGAGNLYGPRPREGSPADAAPAQIEV